MGSYRFVETVLVWGERNGCRIIVLTTHHTYTDWMIIHVFLLIIEPEANGLMEGTALNELLCYVIIKFKEIIMENKTNK